MGDARLGIKNINFFFTEQPKRYKQTIAELKKHFMCTW